MIKILPLVLSVSHRTPWKNKNAVSFVNRELKHARFYDADGNRKWAIFSFNSPSHNHIHITKYVFSVREE